MRLPRTSSAADSAVTPRHARHTLARADSSGGRLKRSAVCFLYLACCLGLLPSRLAAADGESVRLSIPDCADASGPQIAQLVGLELASRENLTLDDSGNGIQASLECRDDSAVIRVVDPQRDGPLVLEMQLAQTRPEARPRLLALAIAELIATSRLEHTSYSAPPPRAEALYPTSLSIAVGTARAYQPGLWSPVIAAGAAHRFHSIALTADLNVDWTSHRTTNASIDARTVSLAIAPSLVALRGKIDLDFRLGLRAGYAWLAGEPRNLNFDAASVSAPFLAPIAGTAVLWHMTERWSVSVSLEVGYVIVPVRGQDPDGARLLELKGLRASALIGPALAL
jgi:hypothetical protein